jgi:glycosyltransferase involved in cell wall biosynthesis
MALRPTSNASSLEFSVVVPTFNRSDAVHELLSALALQDFPTARFEVILVDDGSEPPLVGIEERYRDTLNVRVIRQENRGCGPARQTGVDHAVGRYLAFTDDDCRPGPGWLSAFARALSTSPDGAVAGWTRNALTHSALSEATQLAVNELVLSGRQGDTLEFAPTCNLAVPRAAFAAIGGIDRDWRNSGGEDRMFCMRWRAAGHALRFEPSADVRHAHRLTLSEFLRLHVRYGTGAWMVHHQHADLGYEPPRFYWRLLRVSFGRYPLPFALRVTAATLLAQCCTVFGVLAGALGGPATGAAAVHDASTTATRR